MKAFHKTGIVLLIGALTATAIFAGAFNSVAIAAVPAGPPVFTNPLNITNLFQPFVPGGTKVFTGTKDRKASVIVDIYTTDTRTFQWNGAGVACHVLIETEFQGGQIEEISHNYYAQADDGSVYYFGELVDTYVNGVVAGHEGSWLVGGPTLPNDPADAGNAPNPGLFMPANPEVGDKWKPEDLAPIVDETVECVQVNLKLNVTAGKFTGAIQVLETSSLDTTKETKWYIPTVGVAKGKTKGEKFELIATTLRSFAASIGGGGGAINCAQCHGDGRTGSLPSGHPSVH